MNIKKLYNILCAYVRLKYIRTYNIILYSEMYFIRVLLYSSAFGANNVIINGGSEL